jgi:hypothetical protein
MNFALLQVDVANKSSLISESGIETQVNIHSVEKNLTTRYTYDL